MTDQERVRDYIREAHKHAVSGNRDNAMELIRKALALDPDERVITDTILSMEESGTRVKSDRSPKAPDTVTLQERTDPMAIDPKLEKALSLSEQCRNEGDDQKALAYLRKAKKLFPDSSLVDDRLASLTLCLQAENLVSAARKNMENGDMNQAVRAVRQAFRLLPDTPGLEEVIGDLESATETTHQVQFSGDYQHDVDLDEEEDLGDFEAFQGSVDDLIERIRQLVREDLWDDAALLVEQGVTEFPGNELLETFKVKFKRLGFLS